MTKQLEELKGRLGAHKEANGKHIYTKADRRWPPSKIPQGDDPAYSEEAFAKDHTRGCSHCGMSPVVNAVGMCGPCTWGESKTADGNW